MVVLHQDDMEDVYDDQNINGVVLDCVSGHEGAHYSQVDDEEDGVSDGDPPVDTRVLSCQGVEIPLDNEGGEGCLLHSGLNADV